MRDATGLLLGSLAALAVVVPIANWIDGVEAQQTAQDCAWTSRAVGGASYVVLAGSDTIGTAQRWDTAMRIAVTAETADPRRDVEIRQRVRVECPTVPVPPPPPAKVSVVVATVDSLVFTSIEQEILLGAVVVDTFGINTTPPIEWLTRDSTIVRLTYPLRRYAKATSDGTTWLIATSPGATPDSVRARVQTTIGCTQVPDKSWAYLWGDSVHWRLYPIAPDTDPLFRAYTSAPLIGICATSFPKVRE